MFQFLMFFRGKQTSAVENIDHDKTVEMIFDALPQVKQDSRWSFAVMRCIPMVFLLALLTGCSTTGRPEYVGGETLDAQLDAYIDEYVDQVLDQCIELHGMYNARTSPVDCAFIGDLSAMHVSLPSIEYHEAHVEDIARMEQNWCSAAGSKTGKTARWVRHFRRDKGVISRPCFAQDVLQKMPNGR
jgi:hypothetical protein